MTLEEIKNLRLPDFKETVSEIGRDEALQVKAEVELAHRQIGEQLKNAKEHGESDQEWLRSADGAKRFMGQKLVVINARLSALKADHKQSNIETSKRGGVLMTFLEDGDYYQVFSHQTVAQHMVDLLEEFGEKAPILIAHVGIPVELVDRIPSFMGRGE